MSIAESDLGTNGNRSNLNGNEHGTGSGVGTGTGTGTASRPGTGTATGTEDHHPADEDDCMAHAELQMPWLDFNARLQLKGQKKKKAAPRAEKQAGGFKLPGFTIRKKDSKDGDGKNGEARDGSTSNGASGKNKTNGNHFAGGSDDWTEPDLTVPKKKSIFTGWDGLAVSIAGIVLPTLVVGLGVLSIPKRLTLVLLNHPVETMIELALILAVPLANYFVWSALTKNKFRFNLWRGLALGGAIGTSLIVAAVCVAAVFGGQTLQGEIGTAFATGFTWIALLFVLAAAASIYLANRARLTHDFDKSRLRILTVTIAGAVMSMLAFVAAEARPWYIRIAEGKALSNNPAEREEGWKILRALNPEKEILMECSDARAAGLCGLFLPIKTSNQHELYFSLTGKPYSFKDIANNDLSSMPDDYLSQHVVGDKVPGLSMTRSSITGLMHPNSLSSTLDWTFVFKNQTQSPQEARAELGLPPGAVITGLTLWNKGEPGEASFAASGKAEKYVTSHRVAGHDSPAIVSDLGHGRMLLHCFPVRDSEELKVRVTMVLPLKPDGATGSTLALPRLIAENFEIGDEHQIRLRSSELLGSTCKSFSKGTNPDGTKAIFGSLTREQIESANVLVTAQRSEFKKPVIVLDKLAIEFQKEEDNIKAAREERAKRARAVHRLDSEVLSVSIDGSRSIQKQFEELTNALEKRATVKGSKKKTQIKAVKPKYVVETVSKIAAPAPKNLIIVLDGSSTLKEYRSELVRALNNIPENVPTKLLIASNDDKAPVAVSLKEGIKQLASEDFVGGHDNLKSVVKAAELAGETNQGAVLWVHGPQPILNQEIYIMSPYVAAPTFYELPLGSGDTDTFDFFKNHSEIGPFSQVPRVSRSVSEDLGTFFSKWRANQNGYEVHLAQVTDKPEQAVTATPEEARELLALHANEQIKAMVLARHIRKSARYAVSYRLVTPVSCAIVSHTNDSDIDIDDAALANRMQNSTDSFATSSSSNYGSTATSSYATGSATSYAAPNYDVQSGSADSSSSGTTPILTGATNGTIAPQGYDATFITGVNTAGTVRVNNLANLEALLNIIANLSEVGLALVGAIIVLHALVSSSVVVDVLGQEIEVGRFQRITFGLGLIVLGLAFPGLINWFVASARDANLFS